jgi:hypothetical protein
MRTVPVLLSLLVALGVAHAAPSSPLAPTEALFLEFLDARDAVAYINSGHVDEWEGAKIDEWTARQLSRHQALLANIKTLKPAELPPADAAALAAINITLADFGDPSPAVANAPGGPTCADRHDKALDYEGLSAALPACYREIGNKLSVEGGTIDRGGAL